MYAKSMAKANKEIQDANAQRRTPPYSILQDPGKPSWERSWWERNGKTYRPFAIVVGFGLALMLLALMLAEFGVAKANAAPLPSNPPTGVLAASNWGAAAPVPAPMPVRYFAPKGVVCPVGLDTGSGSPIRTLELRLPEERCALTAILVGDDVSVEAPRE
jgi:hypothetical protein